MPEIDINILAILAFLVSFLITLTSIPSIITVAKIKHLYDEPDERTVHEHIVPTLGGLAIFAGITVASLLFIDINSFPELNYVIAAVIVMFFIGIKDDILAIAPIKKLLGQIAAAVIVTIVGNLYISNIHGFFGIYEIHKFIGIPLTIFTIIVIINGFNLIDGIDGLSGSIGILTTATFGIWFYLTKNYGLTIFSLIVIGALLGFLRYNFFSKKEKIFMGDTGSLILGLIVSVLIIKFNQLNIDKNFTYSVYGSPAISFAILIIPMFDTVRVMFIRYFQNKPIFSPDKQHIHHLFLRLGFSHKKAVFIIVTINFMFIILSFYLSNYLGIITLVLLFVLLGMIIFYIPSVILEKQAREKLNK